MARKAARNRAGKGRTPVRAKRKAGTARAKTSRAKAARGKAAARRAPGRAKRGKAPAAGGRGAPMLVVPADLESRLLALALQMETTFDAVLLQALSEFADAWEDHFRTVAALADDGDRVQLSNRPE